MSSENTNRRERSAKDPDPQVPKHGAKKDTRQWCKGKVGREHKPEWVRTHMGWPFHNDAKPWYTLACKACGKHLDRCWPWLGEPECKCGHHEPARTREGGRSV